MLTLKNEHVILEESPQEVANNQCSLKTEQNNEYADGKTPPCFSSDQLKGFD